MKRFSYVGGGGNRLSSYCKAFTLAEVLVTLGIIGVVSAMTVPSLMQNYQRQSYVTQLHKVYNELSQAALRYQTDKNALDLKEAGLNSQSAVDSFITTYFKVVSTCDTSTSPCFADAYKKMSGSQASFITTKKAYQLASGASIRPSYNDGNRVISVVADINGPKGPNIAGRDLFLLCLYKNGVIDDTDDAIVNDDGELVEVSIPISADDRDKIFNDRCASSSVAIHGCLGKILNDNWEMKY